MREAPKTRIKELGPREGFQFEKGAISRRLVEKGRRHRVGPEAALLAETDEDAHDLVRRPPGQHREIACGAVDVKSFYMDPREEVAERIALCAKDTPVAKLSVVPDCGFFPVPRWVAFEKLKRLAARAALARKQLGVA